MGTHAIGQLIDVFAPVAVAGATYLAYATARLLTAKTKREYVVRVRQRIDDAVAVAVREIQQRNVDGLKSESPRNRLSLEQRAEARQLALDSVKAQLGRRGLAEMVDVLELDPAMVDRLLVTRIEAEVHDIKARAARIHDSETAGSRVPFVA